MRETAIKTNDSKKVAQNKKVTATTTTLVSQKLERSVKFALTMPLSHKHIFVL